MTLASEALLRSLLAEHRPDPRGCVVGGPGSMVMLVLPDGDGLFVARLGIDEHRYRPVGSERTLTGA